MAAPTTTRSPQLPNVEPTVELRRSPEGEAALDIANARRCLHPSGSALAAAAAPTRARREPGSCRRHRLA